MIDSEQRAHDLALTFLGSGIPEHRENLLLSYETDETEGRFSNINSYVIKYKKSYDFLYEFFLTEYEQ